MRHLPPPRAHYTITARGALAASIFWAIVLIAVGIALMSAWLNLAAPL